MRNFLFSLSATTNEPSGNTAMPAGWLNFASSSVFPLRKPDFRKSLGVGPPPSVFTSIELFVAVAASEVVIEARHRADINPRSDQARERGRAAGVATRPCPPALLILCSRFI